MDAAVHLILRDADPLGLITATRDNWTGIAHAMPMSDYESMRHILNKSGVYVLIGIEEGQEEPLETIYIGEAENISSRLTNNHAQIVRDDVTWKRVIIFTSTTNDLHKAHIKWVEHKLVSMAKLNTSIKLYNSTLPTEPGLPDFDRVFIESFLDKMLVLYPILGVSAFKPSESELMPPKHTGEELFYIKNRGEIIASGYLSSSGFTITKGSRIKSSGTVNQGVGVKRLREYLVSLYGDKKDASDRITLGSDLELTSLSNGSNLVLGMSSNGREHWKNAEGLSFNELNNRFNKNI